MTFNKSKKLWPLYRVYFSYLAAAIAILLIGGGFAVNILWSEKNRAKLSFEQTAEALQQSNEVLSNHLPFQLASLNLGHSAQQFISELEIFLLKPDTTSKALRDNYQQLRQHYQKLEQYKSLPISDALKSQLFEHSQIMISLAEEIIQPPIPSEIAQRYPKIQKQLKQTEQILAQINHKLNKQIDEIRHNQSSMNAIVSNSFEQQQFMNRQVAILIVIMALIIVLPLLFNTVFFHRLRNRFDALSNYAYEISRENYTHPPFRANDTVGHLAISLYRLSRQVQRYLKQIREHASHAENAQAIADRLANYDPLTGLANRRHFRQLLENQLSHKEEPNTSYYLLFLDLDNFKEVNDVFGHESGDRLLSIIGARLENSLRPEDEIARLGGDEFSMIISCDETQIDRVAEKILDNVAQPISLNETCMDISISIGITRLTAQELNVSTLLKQADMAMYQAKASGKNNFAFYSKELEEEVLHNQKIITEAKQALANNEFELYYQPKVDIDSGAAIGCEALIRWNHPEKGLLSPAAFLPIIEQHPLMLELEHWVLITACKEASEWVNQGHQIQLAVNITIKQFFAHNFVSQVQQALVNSGLPPHLLELEITETMLMDDIRRGERILGALRQLGISIALDDFGTGYSSLGYLQELPLDCLKLDRSFVQAIKKNSDASIIDAIINLSHRLNLKVVAEGVETNEQLHRLQELECNIGQGYLFSPPVPYRQFLTLLIPHTLQPISLRNSVY